MADRIGSRAEAFLLLYRQMEGILEKRYDYYVKNPERMPREMQAIADREGRERAAVDYISGMTDGYAMEKFGEIYIPFAWTVK